MEKKEAFNKWSEFYLAEAKSGNEQMWPSETLIRLLKGKYIPNLNKDYKGKKVLEVGIGNGNNIPFLATLGLEIYGTEVDEPICKMVKEKLSNLNISADVKVGFNKNLPFPDNYFDLLISWNVIHYEKDEEDMNKAIREYQRVLKPGGRTIISTTGPENSILRESKNLGNHRYLIGREDTFRKGEVFFYFDNESYIEYYFSKYFDNINIGRTNSKMITEVLDWFLITGTKKI